MELPQTEVASVPEVESTPVEDVASLAAVVEDWLGTNAHKAYMLGQTTNQHYLPIIDEHGGEVGRVQMTDGEVKAFQRGIGMTALMFRDPPFEKVALHDETSSAERDDQGSQL